MSLVRNGSNRVMVYTNEIAFETDLLRSDMYRMTDVAFLAQALIGQGFGNGVALSGLACTPTGPATLNALIAPGSLFAYVEYDPTAYSSIPSDTTDMLYKMAINLASVNTSTFTGGPITAPVGGGNSVYWIIEAQFATQDLNDTNRPYYDSTNPTVPFYVANPDTRNNYINFVLKEGTPGSSPTIPAPDAGYTGLYAILVANGQTTITSGNISVYPNAPFITQSLINVMTLNNFQQGYPATASDVGSANAYVANPAVPYTGQGLGAQIKVFITHANTTASVLNVSSLGNMAIIKQTPIGDVALGGTEMPAGYLAEFVSNGSSWVLVNPATPFFLGASVYTQNVQGPGPGIGPGSNFTFAWEKVDYDHYSMYNAGDKGFVAPIAGYYLVTAYVQGALNVTDTTYMIMDLQYNGASYGELSILPSATQIGLSGSQEIFLNASDYVSINIANASTLHTFSNATGTGNTSFQIEYLGISPNP